MERKKLLSIFPAGTNGEVAARRADGGVLFASEYAA
jgi:hypothetical protein